MRTDLPFATDGFQQAIRFVLVNDRVLRTDQHCTLCGGPIEKGYVRDSRTRLIYCDAQCFAGWAAASVLKTRGRKAS
jgi:nitrite reductase/ring-hydroxylating ferredoxin subunit